MEVLKNQQRFTHNCPSIDKSSTEPPKNVKHKTHLTIFRRNEFYLQQSKYDPA